MSTPPELPSVTSRSGLIDLRDPANSGLLRVGNGTTVITDTGRLAVQPQAQGVADPAAAGPNLLAIALRRWPLLLVMAIVGGVGGFLYYVQKPRTYQSSAQVLVIKKRAEMTSANDARGSYLEDYVATQVTLLKSEQILLAAARRIGPGEANLKLPENERDRAAVLAGGLTVARDKEAGVAAGGNGVLNLTFRSGSPDASRRVLEAIIRTYQAELSNIYDEATRSRLNVLDKQLRSYQRDLETSLANKGTKNDEIRQITEEEVPSIRARVSVLRDKELALELEQVVLTQDLEAVDAAGDDKAKRQALVYQFTIRPRNELDREKPEVSGPFIALRFLEAERADLAERLGKDHPDLRKITAKIELHKQLYSTGDAADELVPIVRRMRFQKRAIDEQLTRIRAQLRADRDTLRTVGPKFDELAQLQSHSANLEASIAHVRKETFDLEATQSAGGYDAKVITEPGLGYQVAPVLMQCLLAGIVLGMLVGGGLGYLAEVTDKGFRSSDEVRARLGLAIIGHLPKIRPVEKAVESVDAMLVTVHRPKCSESEGYRGVRTQLFFSTQGRGHQLIQVTSPNPGDGKSTLAANLAVSIAQSGKRVILVDGDLRKPRVHKLFGVSPETGLASVVSGETRLDTAVCRSVVPNLDLLPCGPRPANPAELLTSPNFQAILSELRSRYDFVLVDTPPVLAVTDPTAVAPRVDGVILVIRMTNRARPAAERARDQLAAIGANMLGVIVNGSGVAGRGAEAGYKYGYGYQYQYQYEYEYADHYDDDAPAKK